MGAPYLLLVLILGTIIVDTNGQTVQEGVDLVTRLSNNLLSPLLGSLADQESENVVIGPFALSSAFAMVLEASSGKTRQEILKFLNITLDEIPTLRVGFKAYCELFLEHSSQPEAAGAFNSVTVHSGFQLQPAFRAVLAKNYCANLTASAPAGTSLTLESHAGVMSHWKDFEKLAVFTFLSHHDLRPFTKADGISVPVPMVPLVGVFKAGYWEECRVIYMPLESNMVGMAVIMADDPRRLNSIVKVLTEKMVSELLDSLQGEELQVFMPQFTTLNKQDFTPWLQQQGVELAFNGTHADLSRASDKTKRTYLDKISQSAYFTSSFVAINSVSGVSAHVDRTKRDASKIYINQPFIFLIVHRDTYLVLLAGKIENPTQVPAG